MIDDVPHLREYMESENLNTAKTVVKINNLNDESIHIEQISTALKVEEALIATLTCSSNKHAYLICYFFRFGPLPFPKKGFFALDCCCDPPNLVVVLLL